MTRLEIVVLQHDDERLALANALIRALGTTAGSVRRGDLGALPDDCAMIVFASELPAYLAALPRARRVKLIERTLVLNAYRDEVLALLEAHGLGGAIECEDPDGWAADGKMFVRKEALAPRKGEPVPGDGRESDRYVLWTLYDRTTMVTGSLASLVASYASECWRFANRHDALMVTSAQARAHGLPAISLRVNTGRVNMTATLFPSPTGYFQLYQAFGSGLWLSVENDLDAGSIVDAARARSADAVAPVFGDPEPVTLSGAPRTAVARVSGPPNGMASLMHCFVRVPHRTGNLLVLFGTAAPSREPSCGYVLAVPALKILADSLSIVDDQA